MIDKFKCEVTANRLVMEVLDENGDPVVVTKKDTFGQTYQETAEVQYRRGDIIFLPEAAIKPRLSSLKMVLEPVKVAPVKGDSNDNKGSFNPPRDEKERGGDDDKRKEPTVSELIPKKTLAKDETKTAGKK